MLKYITALFIIVLIQHNTYSQIRGEIRVSNTGDLLPGASIVFSGDGDGTISNNNGAFEVPASEQLIISAIGYITKNLNIIPGKDYYIVFLEPRDYYLQEVIVEAFNRSRRILDVPGSLSLISSAQIEREKPVTIVPLLNQAPGVFAHSGALNTSRITIRGIGARVPYSTGKVRAYLNNIPLTNGSGISIVEDIDPAIIDRIELIKGPATSVYGAGLGGTIILTPKKPLLQDRAISNSFHKGSWGLYRNTVSLDTGTDNFGLSLQYNHTQSNGYRQNNQYRRDGFTAISQLNPGDKTDLTVLFAYTSLTAQIPSSIDSLTFITQPASAAQNWLQTRGYEDYDKLLTGISANYTFNNNLSANLSLFSTVNREKEMRPFDVLNENRLSGGTRLKINYSGILAGGSYQILGGGELFTENYWYTSHENIGGLGEKGILISDNSEKISYYNGFAQADIDMHRFNFSAGININSSSTNYMDLLPEENINPSGRYSYGKIVSPRISANYRYLKSNSAFITFSHGFSPPSLSETLTPKGFINPDIKPEISWNIEGGFRGNLLDNTLFYDINIYMMQVKNLLVAERVGEDSWVGKNAGESVHKGIESELQMIIFQSKADNSAHWWQLDHLSISPNITINYFRFTDFIDEGVDYSGKRLPGIPDKVVNAALYGRLQGGLYALINFRRVYNMPMNDANTLFTESYNLTNIKFGYKSKIFRKFHADAFVSAKNIFNKKYASMILVNAPSFNNRPPRYYYPGNPINFSTGISISYLLD